MREKKGRRGEGTGRETKTGRRLSDEVSARWRAIAHFYTHCRERHVSVRNEANGLLNVGFTVLRRAVG